MSAKKTGKKEKLKPISFYGCDIEEVIRAFMQVDPEKIKESGKEKR